MSENTRGHDHLPQDIPMAVDGARRRLRSGMGWFFWIAGLSMINSLVMMFGSDWGGVFGLGVTQVVGVLAQAFAQQSGGEVHGVVDVLVLAACLMIAALFAIWGVLGAKRMAWAIMAGMGLYLCDALIFLVAMDFLGLAFHGLALFGLYGGYKACRELQQLEAWSEAMGEDLPLVAVEAGRP